MRRTFSRTTPLVIAALALGLGACHSAPHTSHPADAAGAEVTVVADDTVFLDPPTQLPAGTSILAIDNVGDAPHDLTFEGVEDATIGAAAGTIEAGEVTLSPGTYAVYCSVGGHRAAGMEFAVTVS